MGNCNSPEPAKVETVEQTEAVPVIPPKEDPAPPAATEPKLVIKIIAARGVRNSDWLPGLGKPDCYCIVKSEGKELFKTKILNNTLEPVWNETAEVHDYEHGKPLEFSVWDKDVVGSDLLGKVNLEAASFAEGFNREMPLAEAGKDIHAFLKIMIKVAGKDIPSGPSPQFELVIEKGQSPTYGLDIDTQDGKTLFVTNISPGPCQTYNDSVPPEKHILKTDFIISCNGATAGTAALLEPFKKESKVALVVRRAVTIPIILDRVDENVPIGAEFPKKPVGEALVVTDITGGLFKDYNDTTADADLKIQVGDRIVSIAGFKGKSPDLLNQLTKCKGKFQVELVRMAPEKAHAVAGVVSNAGSWRFW